MREDKKLANNLNYDGIEKRNTICINVFSYENKLVFPIYISDQKFENSIDLLLVIDENNLHYVYIKDFDRLMFYKTKYKKQKILLQKLLTLF